MIQYLIGPGFLLLTEKKKYYNKWIKLYLIRLIPGGKDLYLRTMGLDSAHDIRLLRPIPIIYLRHERRKR